MESKMKHSTQRIQKKIIPKRGAEYTGKKRKDQTKAKEQEGGKMANEVLFNKQQKEILKKVKRKREMNSQVMMIVS